MRRLTQQAALVLIFLGSALPLQAFQADAWSSLYVCNKGTVPVELVVAMRQDDATRSGIFDMMRGTGKYYWKIEGNTIAPQTCSESRNNASPAYIAFGFTDSRGVWGSGKIADVPDLGSIGRPLPGDLYHEDKVLVRGAKVVCARKDETEYAIDDDFQTDCATLKISGGRRGDVGHGPFLPLTSALLYYPPVSDCNPQPFAACSEGAYYLNIAPKPGDRELHATVGSERSATSITNPDSEDSLRLKQYPACNVITEAEAEKVLGVTIDPPQPGRTLCRYQEPGYGTDPSKKKQVTIGIWRSTAASPEDVNNRRNAIIKDKSLLPVSYKELPNFGDAALWVWAGGYYGALYTFRGGTVEVAVKISGVPEAVALSTAKKFAARALGGTGKTGFVYAARKNQ